MVDYNELSGIEAFANRSDVRADPTDLRLLYIETDHTAMEGRVASVFRQGLGAKGVSPWVCNTCNRC